MEGEKVQGKVVLIFPDSDEPLQAFGTRLRSFAPPLGPLYLAAHLIEGFDVELLDLSARGFDRGEVERAVSGASAVGISITSYNRRSALQLIRLIRSINPSVPIAVGGPGCYPEGGLPEGVDLMALGEAELTVPRIFEGLTRPDPGERDEILSETPGIIFRDKYGRVREGKPYVQIHDLDSLRLPLREIVPKGDYTIFGAGRAGVGASIITSRGCPYRCRFCTRPKLVGYRERSVESVLEEIERIYRSGYEVLYIVDDNFTANRRRVEAIAEGIVKRGIRLAILAQGRANTASKEMFEAMREAGFVLISFGLESGVQEVLDFYRKGTTVEQGVRAVEWADEVGLFTCASFILGAPIETEEHLERTIKYAYELPLDVVFFSVLNYARGSDLWEEARERGLIRDDEDEVLADSSRGLSNFPAAYLRRLASEAQMRFYLRPKLWIRYVRKLKRCKDRRFVGLLLRGFLRFWADFLGDHLP